jgi:hypothetical protein
MQWLLAALVVAPVVYLVVGAARGRVQVRACCPDPAHDKRLVGAFVTDTDTDTDSDSDVDTGSESAGSSEVTSRRGSS